MILLSAGHHPDAVGASHDGFSEYPNTWEWVLGIRGFLQRLYAVEAILVPTGGLKDKVYFINEAVVESPNSVAVEVHFNSAVGARGSETLYCPGSEHGIELAECIQSRLAHVFPPSRGVKEGWYKMDRPGVIDFYGDEDGDETPDYFLRATHCPAVIIEPEFVQNHSVLSVKFEQGCEAIAAGIMEAIT